MSPNDALDRLDESIKKLRTAYEQYFAGVERVPPVKDRAEVRATFRRLLTERINNTAWRFRLQSLQASLITHEAYWDRICRQIEEGTFKPHLSRAQRQAQLEAKQPNGAPMSPESKASAAATPVAAAGPQPLRVLYESFVKARADSGDSRPVSFEAFSATIEQQTRAVKERFGCGNVEFKVAVKDGKAILKATPR